MQKEIPILFSTPMVQAILAGKKTETRRILGSGFSFGYSYKTKSIRGARAFLSLDKCGEESWNDIIENCKYGKVGDVLWVRESHAKDFLDNFHYKASSETWCGKWKPSIHMPKAASRIWLLNEGVTAERLHDITEAGAIAEGVIPLLMSGGHVLENAKTVYSQLWNRINGPESWNANPWVWVIKYKVLSTTGKPC